MALKHNRLVIALLATAAMTVLAACASTPAATATPEPTPTATPVPVQAISIDPRTDPDGFLAALPASEVDCASSAVGGRDNLARLISFSPDNTDGISDTQLRVLASCVGNDTVQRIVIGQLELETGGLSQETSACIADHTNGIDFASIFSGQAIGADSVVSTLQALFCLSPEERRALEASDQEIIEVAQLGGIDALECAVDGAGPNGLADFGNIFGVDGSVDPLAVGTFMPLLIDCGVVDEDAFGSSGISPDQISCLFEELDSETLSNLLSASGDPSELPDLSSAAEILSAASACGLDLQQLLDSAGADISGDGGSAGTPVVSTELLVCLTENGVSAAAAASYAAGLTAASDPAIAAGLATCEAGGGSGGSSGGGIVVPDGSGGSTTIDPAIFDSLPISAEQAQCMIDEIGIEGLEGIASGTVSPLTALGALGACNISLADLIAG